MSIGVGIIGANPDRGWAAMAHIPALKASPDYEIRAVCTSRRETADAAARKYGVSLSFCDAREMCERPEIDLVVVVVRLPRHFELVSAAIAAGKDVYCEWPLGNGLSETVELARMARAKSVRGFVGLQSRAAPELSYVRDLVREGYVGDVLSTTLIGLGMVWGEYVDQANAYIADQRNGVTLLTVPLGHTLDALCGCLGEFQSVDARLAWRRTTTRVIETGEIIPMSAPDQVVIGGTLQGGALAGVQYRGGMPRGTHLMWEINGRDGDLQIISDGGHIGMFDLRLCGGRGADTALQPLSVPGQYHWAPPGTPKGFPYNVAQNYANLAHDLREGTSLCATFEDAVTRHRLLHAIETASATGLRQSGI